MKYGVQFPGGDLYTIERTTQTLDSMNVKYTKINLGQRQGAAFVFEKEELTKMPKDKDGPYLPTYEDNGRTISEYDDDIIEHFIKEWSGKVVNGG
jgi:hypothetical protein